MPQNLECPVALGRLLLMSIQPGVHKAAEQMVAEMGKRDKGKMKMVKWTRKEQRVAENLTDSQSLMMTEELKNKIQLKSSS
jgi:hypothetical protein